jgi:acyl-CoA synthetase (AMP-forming)/AMP-acid ligase II
MNTTDFLKIATAICPDKEAIVFEGKRFTFGEMNQRVNRLSNALLKLGVQEGDRVALMQVNCNQCVETYFAVAKIGGIYVPLNFRAKENEITYMLENSGANTLFVGDRYIDLITSVKPDLTTVKNFVSIENRHEDIMMYYDDLLASSSAEEVSADIDDSETTILLYTAGTTGFPKAVMLSHNSFSYYMLEHVTPAAPDIEEKNILTVPLYHVAGIQAMLAAIYGGRTLVMERQFDPGEWVELVEKEKVHRAMMVPTMLKQLMEHPDFSKHDLSSLRVITYGAGPMPIGVIKKAVELFPGVSFINAFGQTETASTITTLSPEDHIITGTEDEKEREKKMKRLTSIGKGRLGAYR